jgi:hypothetical protein
MFLTLLQSGGAGPGVITGTLSAVESGADTFSATGVVEGGTPDVAPTPRAGSSRNDRQRRRPGIFPALPREADPALPIPRRTRRRREAELVLWLNH